MGTDPSQSYQAPQETKSNVSIIFWAAAMNRRFLSFVVTGSYYHRKSQRLKIKRATVRAPDLVRLLAIQYRVGLREVPLDVWLGIRNRFGFGRSGKLFRVVRSDLGRLSSE